MIIIKLFRNLEDVCSWKYIDDIPPLARGNGVTDEDVKDLVQNPDPAYYLSWYQNGEIELNKQEVD